MVSESTIGTEERPLRIVIAGGGSGGHISPAVAIVEALRQQVVVDAIWVGARDAYEGAAAHDLGIPFYRIPTGKLRRYFSLETIGDSVRVPFGVMQAWRILRRYRPDAVVSTGGFVSVPSIVAARFLSIPSLTHEQTASIGLATRINARFCSVVALSFDRSHSQLPAGRHRVVVSGNPLRQFVTSGCAYDALQRFNLEGRLPLIYVTGGAQGSRAINAAIQELLPTLLVHAEIIHQCGPRSEHTDFDILRASAEMLPKELQGRYVVCERIGSELGDVYSAASLVIGRAGAGTVTELAATGLPSILIPLPGADEQRQNALYLVENGAAVLLDQSELTPERLLELVSSILADPERLREMSANASDAAVLDAADRLAHEILALAGLRQVES